MTLREIVDDCDSDNPLQALLIIFQILRSIIQREPATVEGCCSSVLGFLNLYGKVTNENVQQFLDDLGQLVDIDIPAFLIWEAINCDG